MPKHKPYSTRFSQELQDQLEFEEGKKNHIYLDSLKIPTIGIGHNLNACPNWPDSNLPIAYDLTDAEIYKLLELDLTRVEDELNRRWPDFKSFGQCPRKDAILAMAFQLGVSGFMQFVKMREALHYRNWEEAARCGENSKWFSQCKNRAERVLSQIRDGRYYQIPKR